MADNGYPLDIEQRVYLERVRIFFQHAAGSQMRVAAAAFFAALSLYFAGVPPWPIVIWVAGCVLIIIFLTIVGARYPKNTREPENARKWANARMALGVALGLMLGVSVFMLPAQEAVVSELMIFIILLTAVSMTAVGYSTMPLYGFSVGLPGMVLLTISFLRAQDQLHYTFAAMALIALVILLKKSLGVSRTMIEGIRVNERLKDEINLRMEAERDADYAREEAERANAAKSDFLANMSHELRTPMNAVIGFSGALESGIAGKLNDKQAEYVNDIHNSGEHLLTLINDLLDLSKIEAGKLKIKEEEFDLPGAIDRCLPLLKDQANKAGIALDAEIPIGLPLLRADRRLVGQMILNLLSNAVKFSAEGGHVTVAARNGNIGGIAVSVTDTGCGMNPEEISLALLPFEQAENGWAKEGTGLGLPLVKRMAELHGGSLTIDSAPGEGTTATIAFPPERIVAGAVQG